VISRVADVRPYLYGAAGYPHLNPRQPNIFAAPIDAFGVIARDDLSSIRNLP